MDIILQRLPGVMRNIDDILVTGSNDAEHLKNVEALLKRLQQYGFHLKRPKSPKCNFLHPRVECLGHLIDSQGLQVTKSKVEAIVNTPSPQNVQLLQLRSFLGLLNYYGKFIPIDHSSPDALLHSDVSGSGLKNAC